MVLEVVAHAGEVQHQRYSDVLDNCGGADSTPVQYGGRVERPGRQDYFGLGCDSEQAVVCEGPHLDRGRTFLGAPGVGDPGYLMLDEEVIVGSCLINRGVVAESSVGASCRHRML